MTISSSAAHPSATWTDRHPRSSGQEGLRPVSSGSSSRYHQQHAASLSQSHPSTSHIHHPPHPYHSIRHNSLDSQSSSPSHIGGHSHRDAYPHTFSTNSTSPRSIELIYTPRQIPNVPNLPPLNYPLPLSTDQHLAAIAVMQERQESWTRAAAQSSSSASSASSPGTGSPIQSLAFGSAQQGSGSGQYPGGRGSGAGGSGNGKSKSGGGGGGGGGTGKSSKPRKKVAKACLSCQKSHLTCDESEYTFTSA